MDTEQLNQILEDHATWLRDRHSGSRANLYDDYVSLSPNGCTNWPSKSKRGVLRQSRTGTKRRTTSEDW